MISVATFGAEGAGLLDFDQQAEESACPNCKDGGLLMLYYADDLLLKLRCERCGWALVNPAALNRK